MQSAQEDLFGETLISQPINLLNQDGIANYYGKLWPAEDASAYLAHLLKNIAWQCDQVVIFGRRIYTKRKVAWYAEQPFQYTYSNTTKRALPWVEPLQLLKQRVEQHTGETFNSCLLNLYHDGSEGMAWHADAELDLKPNAAIASLSFGAERKFAFKHIKTKQTVSLVLQHGSLLVMKGATQRHWLHRLPPIKRVTESRVNLTFRTIVGN